jgi:N-acyl-D-amino-acid deacylase
MSGAMRAPTPTEMARMSRMLDESLQAGAWGVSTGLIYPPSNYAETDELIALARVCKPYGGIYASHIRNEGIHLLEAVSEAIRIGEEAGVPVEIAHHKASGKANWGKVKESLPLIAEALKRGVQVTCDQYPYVASSTGLTVIVPDWAHEGGNDRLLERLRDHETRARVRHDIRTEYPGWDDPTIDSSWHRIVIASARGHTQFEGLNTWQLAEAWHTDPLEASLDLILAEDANVATVMFSISEEDVQTVMRAPFIMVGSDAGAKAPTGPMSEGKPHPRAYGTFPRVLGRYVRELGVITWEEAIRKMTSLPASKLGLPGRGLLTAGAFADVVVFDPATVADRATFTEPHQFPTGLDYVIVNGVVTVDHGDHTGALAGRVLRRGRNP